MGVERMGSKCAMDEGDGDGRGCKEAAHAPKRRERMPACLAIHVEGPPRGKGPPCSHP